MKREDAVIVCGLGFGDEGKGTIVDALARRFAPADVVRYNGGPQCGHNVVEPGGRWHCFAQFGAGSFTGGSRTILGPKMLVELENLEAEMDVLGQKGVAHAFDRLSVDPRCLLITPMQKIVGRMREIARGDARHGSCGQGVGETVLDAARGLSLTVADAAFRGDGLRKLKQIEHDKLEEARAMLDAAPADAPYLAALYDAYSLLLKRSDADDLRRRYRQILGPSDAFLADAETSLREVVNRGRTLLFEGAQGALLDFSRGFRPHVTKTDTTCRNALDLLDAAAMTAKPFKLGIMRAYGHRHGAGPFVTEDESTRKRFDDPLNRHNPWQGAFRVGWLDLPALRYGIGLNGGVDGLALTGLDRLSGLKTIRVCASYRDAESRSWTSFDAKTAADADWIRGCRSLDWLELPGWRQDLSGVRRFGDLPKNARAFVRFLETKEALGTPVEIVSVGPTAEQKIFLNA